MNIQHLCRICLTEHLDLDDMQPLFEADNRCTEIVARIELCGDIMLKPLEDFPRRICSQCLDSLDVSYKFRTLCQGSETTLYDLLLKSEEIEELAELVGDEHAYSPLKEDMEVTIEYELPSEFVDPQKSCLKMIEKVEEPNDFESVGIDSSEEFLDISETSLDMIYEEIKTPAPKKKKPATTKSKKSMQKQKQKPMKARSVGRPKKIKDETDKPKSKKKLNEERIKIICEVCGNIYPNNSLLKSHMRRHMTHKPFGCELCTKSFACAAELNRHMRVHTGEKPYVCKYCNRAFSDWSTHKKHERIHTNERPFVCQTCGKAFTYSSVLKCHMMIHTGEKPFECIPCKKTFSRKHQLEQHLATIIHRETAKQMQVDRVMQLNLN